MSDSTTDTSRPYWIEFPTFSDERGSLSVVEASEQAPFQINRLYYLYDVPPDSVRGRHAHRELEQVMIAVAGSLDLVVETRSGREEFHLDAPTEGVYIPKLAWRELSDFSSDAMCLVVASRPYEPDDYIHDYDQFKQLLADCR